MHRTECSSHLEGGTFLTPPTRWQLLFSLYVPVRRRHVYRDLLTPSNSLPIGGLRANDRQGDRNGWGRGVSVWNKLSSEPRSSWGWPHRGGSYCWSHYIITWGPKTSGLECRGTSVSGTIIHSSVNIRPQASVQEEPRNSLLGAEPRQSKLPTSQWMAQASESRTCVFEAPDPLQWGLKTVSACWTEVWPTMKNPELFPPNEETSPGG